MPKKNHELLSNEDLARMIAEGFESTAAKPDLVRLETKVDKIDEKLRIVETKLDRALYTQLAHLESRVKKLEEKIGLK